MEPLKYFSFFKYVPTLKEYQLFSSTKKAKAKIKVVQGRVVNKSNQRFLAETIRRRQISLGKISQHHALLTFLGNLPWIQYLGISGTVSMLNANVEDDLDLFVITKANRLWTARFFVILITSILGVRRKPGDQNYQNKLCFNLFFSEDNLKIPHHKQSEYVAHEILQLRPVANKNKTYERLLADNSWILSFFPRVKIRRKHCPIAKRVTPLFGLLEWGLRHFQLLLIKRHQTTEFITKDQLWFFPDDFELRLAKTF